MWFRKPKSPMEVKTEKKLKIPEGVWKKCDNCKEIVYRKEVEKNSNICPKCNYHFRIPARERLERIYDNGQYTEFDANITSVDTLKFKDRKKYSDRLRDAKNNTNLNDVLINSEGKVGGYPIIISVFEFSFMGGSMGSVVGEKLVRGMELAIKKGIPFMSISSSGGARMQEGLLSLMQMAKTSAATLKMAESRIPFISLLADPTTGGVLASFAMLGDVIMAEPKSLIGFAGARVIEQTIGEQIPKGFQRSEFLLEHGLIDMIVSRKELRDVLSMLLKFFAHRDIPITKSKNDTLNIGRNEYGFSVVSPTSTEEVPVT